mmetsp:Transcript_29689/g.84962  ORF Transcript_29689/g.84962 Transcript_29689/m.84962 type:complete len:344 (-) Transcript_29689:405-1436(-)
MAPNMMTCWCKVKCACSKAKRHLICTASASSPPAAASSGSSRAGARGAGSPGAGAARPMSSRWPAVLPPPRPSLRPKRTPRRANSRMSSSRSSCARPPPNTGLLVRWPPPASPARQPGHGAYVMHSSATPAARRPSSKWARPWMASWKRGSARSSGALACHTPSLRAESSGSARSSNGSASSEQSGSARKCFWKSATAARRVCASIMRSACLRLSASHWWCLNAKALVQCGSTACAQAVGTSRPRTPARQTRVAGPMRASVAGSSVARVVSRGAKGTASWGSSTNNSAPGSSASAVWSSTTSAAISSHQLVATRGTTRLAPGRESRAERALSIPASATSARWK